MISFLEKQIRFQKKNVDNLLFRWGLLRFSGPWGTLVENPWLKTTEMQASRRKEAPRMIACYRPSHVFQFRQLQRNETDCQINCFHKIGVTGGTKTDFKERFINTHKMNQLLHTVTSPSNWFPCLCLICEEITQKQMGYSKLLLLKQQEKTNIEGAQTVWTHTREPTASSRLCSLTICSDG
jgi:hypothetical protein